MALDLPAATLVRAGGSALLVVSGVVAIALARGNRGGLALGVTLAAWGSGHIGNNVFEGNAEAGVVWGPILLALNAVRGVGLAGILLWWPAPLRPGERRTFVLVAAAAVLVLGIGLADVAYTPGGWESVRAVQLVPFESDAVLVAIYGASRVLDALYFAIALLFPLRYLATLPEERGLRRQLAWGSVLVFAPLATGNNLLGEGRVFGWTTIDEPFEFASQVIAVALFLAATRLPDARPARVAAHAILALMLAGLAVEAAYPAAADDTAEDIVVGIYRSVSAFLLVYGMLRLGFLGHEVRLRTARRGTVAMAALATLFIVAQVAQQFLSASYGLLTGGIVAGALLFAAAPIQRAVEGMLHPRPSGSAAAASDASAAGDRLVVYREAVRYALTDGAITRAEERHLAQLAQHLGIGAADALAVRHAVEDERAAGRGGAP